MIFKHVLAGKISIFKLDTDLSPPTSIQTPLDELETTRLEQQFHDRPNPLIQQN